jgi:hypothetical protein
LRTLAQAPPEVVDRFYGWSVSEIAKALEETFPPAPNQLGGVSVRDVMGKLRRVVIPQIDENLGLRALLTRVTP